VGGPVQPPRAAASRGRRGNPGSCLPARPRRSGAHLSVFVSSDPHSGLAEVQLTEQAREARVRPQSVKPWLDLDPGEPRGTLLVGPFEPSERSVAVSQTHGRCGTWPSLGGGRAFSVSRRRGRQASEDGSSPVSHDRGSSRCQYLQVDRDRGPDGPTRCGDLHRGAPGPRPRSGRVLRSVSRPGGKGWTAGQNGRFKGL